MTTANGYMCVSKWLSSISSVSAKVGANSNVGAASHLPPWENNFAVGKIVSAVVSEVFEICEVERKMEQLSASRMIGFVCTCL